MILRAPDAPINLADVPLVTNAYQIGLSWTDGTWNGGSPVIDYKLSYAIGTDAYTVLETGVTAKTYTAISLTLG